MKRQTNLVAQEEPNPSKPSQKECINLRQCGTKFPTPLLIFSDLREKPKIICVSNAPCQIRDAKSAIVLRYKWVSYFLNFLRLNPIFNPPAGDCNLLSILIYYG